MLSRTILRRIGTATVAAGLVVGLSGCFDPPTNVTTNVAFGCNIDTDHFLVPDTTGTLDSDYTVTAPQAVKPGFAFEVKVVPEPYFVDGTPTSGGTIANTSQLKFRVAVPAGATLNSHTISGWANVGAGAPTSSVGSGYIEVVVPGPITSNTTATLPTVTLNLTPTGALGTTINPKIYGTSYASYGLSLKSRITGTLVGDITSTLSCFPAPSPSLHSTLISDDIKAPTIAITTPVQGASYARNSTLIADFACADGAGVGVATCVGTVADGAAINTSTSGSKTFTVTATDHEGKTSAKTVTYTIKP